MQEAMVCEGCDIDALLAQARTGDKDARFKLGALVLEQKLTRDQLREYMKMMHPTASFPTTT